MFENKLDTKYGIHYSRWIMSWIRENGDCRDRKGFISWLESLNISEEDIDNMWLIMSNGKLECETSARKFLERRNK